MEAIEKSTKFRELKSVEIEDVNGEIICNRIVSPFYISDVHNIGEIAELFIDSSEIQAIGVVNEEGRARGIVKRNELFALIGQKFGRELYLNRSIMEVITPADEVYYKRNTFSVIDELSDNIRSDVNRYYILTDGSGGFRGIISTFNLIQFLSDMMTKELKAARRVHSAIIAGKIDILTERFEAAGSTVMAGETGGDFQYIRKIGDGRWFISLCDVSGKGLNAGLISVAVSGMYRVYDFSKGIGELVKNINSYIHDLFGGEIFLTGVFIDFNEITGEIAVYDMGHSMFYILREGKAGTPAKQKENIPLGILKELEPRRSCVRLEKGDLIVSYTDGFPEQGNLSNESCGEQRIISLLLKNRNCGLNLLQDKVFDELKAWRLGNAQGDDMSLLLIKYKQN